MLEFYPFYASSLKIPKMSYRMNKGNNLKESCTKTRKSTSVITELNLDYQLKAHFH